MKMNGNGLLLFVLGVVLLGVTFPGNVAGKDLKTDETREAMTDVEIGECNRQGIRGKNEEKRDLWLRQAAEKGNVAACRQLDSQRRKGKAGEQRAPWPLGPEVFWVQGDWACLVGLPQGESIMKAVKLVEAAESEINMGDSEDRERANALEMAKSQLNHLLPPELHPGSKLTVLTTSGTFSAKAGRCFPGHETYADLAVTLEVPKQPSESVTVALNPLVKSKPGILKKLDPVDLPRAKKAGFWKNLQDQLVQYLPRERKKEVTSFELDDKSVQIYRLSLPKEFPHPLRLGKTPTASEKGGSKAQKASRKPTYLVNITAPRPEDVDIETHFFSTLFFTDPEGNILDFLWHPEFSINYTREIYACDLTGDKIHEIIFDRTYYEGVSWNIGKWWNGEFLANEIGYDMH